MEPYDFQRVDLDTLRANDYIALANIQPGGGKTPLGVFSIQESNADVTLIIAPDQTHATAWSPTVEEILGVETRVLGGTGKAKINAQADFDLGYPGVYLASPQYFTRADTSSWMADLCIVDEGHLLNAAGTKGQKKLSGYTVQERREALSSRVGGRLFLSGTAWRNNFERAWATMAFLWPHLNRRGEVAYDNYYFWQAARMDYEDVVTGVDWYPAPRRLDGRYEDLPEGEWRKNIDGVLHYGRPKTVKKYLNESDPGLLLSEMPCAITHFRREACCDFHPNGFLPTEEPQVIERVIPLAPAQKKAIKELEDHMMTWLDAQPLTVDLSITQQQRIRQMALGVPTVTYTENEEGLEDVDVSFDPDCISPFTDDLLELLDELEDEKVVVFMESQKFASTLVKKLHKAGVSAFEYSGPTKKVRDENLARFESDYRVAVVTLASGGTGLDGLQKVTKTEVWFERSVDETNNVQGEARVDRLGGIGQVQRFIYLDDLGRAAGRMSEQLEKRRALAQTLKRR